MKKLFLPLAALALTLGVHFASAAPAVKNWEADTKVVYADTLGRFVATDTVFTDSVSVFGARAVYLFIKSSGSDSVSIPVIQSRLPGGAWAYYSSQAIIPPGTLAVASPLTATTTVTSTRFAWGIYNEISNGGTPVPFGNISFRWRMVSTDARRYATASSATLAPTGTITITAMVWR